MSERDDLIEQRFHAPLIPLVEPRLDAQPMDLDAVREHLAEVTS